MNDLRQARLVFNMAEKDLKALKGMQDRTVFDEEIFGFHAQQCIEKSLKAWLALLGHEYPLTHDLSVLLGHLKTHGEDVGMYWDLVEYNMYAVRFRYELVDTFEQPLDRAAAITQVEELMVRVRTLLDHMEGRS